MKALLIPFIIGFISFSSASVEKKSEDVAVEAQTTEASKNIGNFGYSSSKLIGNKGFEAVYDMGLAINRDIIIAGSFTDEIDFGNGSIKAKSDEDAFIARIESASSYRFVWQYTFYSKKYNKVCDIEVTHPEGQDISFVLSKVSNDKLDDENADFDIHVLQIDSTGKKLAEKTIGGSYSEEAEKIAIDKDENIYICGSFKNEADFLGHDIKSKGKRDAFLLALDKDFNYRWHYTYSSKEDDIARSLSIDKENNIILTGKFNSDSDDSNEYKTLPILIKINSSGEEIGRFEIESKKELDFHDIKFDLYDDIVIAGYYKDSIEFDNLTYTPKFDKEILIFKIDNSFQVKWHYALTKYESGEDNIKIAIDNQNNYFFVTSIISNYNSTENKSIEYKKGIYLFSLNQSGNYQNEFYLMNSGNDNSLAIVCDNYYEVYISGYFRDDFVFFTKMNKAKDDADIFILKLFY